MGGPGGMIQLLLEMLSYPFLVRALTVGLLVALCASLLGVSLVLKRFSMIGDGLSHVGFGALAIASVLNVAPLYLAIPVCIAASFLLLRLSESTRIKGDAAIAMLSAGSLAVGVMVVSMTTGMNTDVYNYMFGSILSLSKEDAVLSIVLCALVLVLFVLFYPRLFAVTFDESFARATGIPTSAYNAALAVLSSVTVVLGMRMMGALLISSLVIFPVLSAMRVGKRYRTVTILSAVIAIAGFLIGMLVSYAYEAPSGASIVCVNIALFLLFAVAGGVLNAVRKN